MVKKFKKIKGNCKGEKGFGNGYLKRDYQSKAKSNLF
ncbi:MAG: hypothetical protein CM15mP50_1320 [Rhodobacterales bacterium]|nr:MAG: hypothetical protein CM15mP50_1320 [Rhodobacterales bacterium]